MAVQSSPRTDEQLESVIETITDLVNGHRRHTRGRQFNGQWDPVKTQADLRDSVGRVSRKLRRHIVSAIDEQACGRVDIKGSHRPDLLVDDAQSLAACG